MKNLVNVTNVPKVETLETYVENYVIDNDSTYLEAIVNYCEKNHIDPASLSIKKISMPIFEKLEAECAKNNLLTYKHDELPI